MAKERLFYCKSSKSLFFNCLQPFFNVVTTILAEGNDCKDIKLSNPSAKSGIYTLNSGKKVECDMDTAGGGWTVSLCFNKKK